MDLNQFSTVDIVLDKANDNIIQRQTISAGDRDGRSLTLQVTNEGSIGEVPGLTANLLWTNHSSGLSDLSAFSVVDRTTSVFKIEYPQNMLTAGKVTAQIQLLHNGKVTHSKKFEIIVLDIAGKLKGVLQSAEYSALVTTLAKANEFETDIAEVSAQLAQKASQSDLDRIESDFDAVVANVTNGNESATNTELVLARDTHPTLKDRLDSDAELLTDINNNKLLKIQNKVANGNFKSDDISTWDSFNQVWRIENDTLYCDNTLGSTARNIYKDFAGDIDDVWFFSAKILEHTDSVNPLIRLNDGANTYSSGLGKFNDIGIGSITVKTPASGKVRLLLRCEPNQMARVDSIFAVNLTSVFGKQNELRREEMEELVHNYIDGSSNDVLINDWVTKKIATSDTDNIIFRNMLLNNTFSDALKYWAFKDASGNVTGSEVTFTATALAGELNQTFKSELNHVYYLSAEVKSDSDKVALLLSSFGQYAYHTGSGEYRRLSVCYKTSAFSPRFSIIDKRESLWTPVSVRKPLLLDLTLMFGEGNEPSKDVMDIYMDGLFSGWNGDITVKDASLSSLAINDNSVDEGTLLPRYLVDELHNVVSKANNVKGEFKFGFTTDVHVDESNNDYYKLKLLSELGSYGNTNFIACGGDLVNGFTDIDTTISQLSKCAKELNNSNVDTFILQGNHDTGFVYFYDETYHLGVPSAENKLTNNTWHNIACKIPNGVVRDANNPYGGYYYKDYENEKIRVITMNSSDISQIVDENGIPLLNPMDVYFLEDQLVWLYEKALNFSLKADKSEWGVVVLNHSPFSIEDSSVRFGTIAEKIFKAYVNGTAYTEVVSNSDYGTVIDISVDCDFTAQGPMEFICAVAGHKHYDRVTNFTFNRPCIGVLHATGTNPSSGTLPPGATRPSRIAGTLSAEAIDLITINKIDRKITCTRFGAGEDRVINY